MNAHLKQNILDIFLFSFLDYIPGFDGDMGKECKHFVKIIFAG